MSRTFLSRVATFSLIGGLNTAAFFVLANLLGYRLGLSADVAAYLAYAALLPVSFFGHRRYTFMSRGRIGTQWAKFIIVQATGLGVIKVATSLAVPGWMAFGLISVAIPLINFVVMQAWVFCEPEAKSRD
ncbi:GtrA family protein [Aminobacter anthyllidis]|uniref:GtrA family protein n=1 Tax=Aminobacter anthyllidis TaxID=1035067 RepID=UPI00245872AA|nr:GtrA family protein [Aminobacter anthyllidis]MDH4984434.1 GtrA family protein [Aminobacter anthyllidis]